MLGSKRWLLAALAAAWLAILTATAVRLCGRAVDDVFITYRYAQNLAAGNGYVFNPGERVFGVTEPAVGLVLGAAAWLTGAAIPTLGTLFTALALAALAAGLWLAGARRGRAAEGALAGTLILGTPLFWTTQGAAAPALLALLLCAARLAVSRPLAAGVLCGIAAAVRPDAVVGGAILGLLVWLETRRLPWRLALAAAACLALVALAAWGWFGAIVPQTLVAKQYHAARNPGSWLGFDSFWGYGLSRLASGPFNRLVPWAVLAGLAGAIAFLRQATRAERLLVLHGLAMVIVYPLLSVPFFSWYAIPPLLAILWGLAQLVGWAGRLAASDAPAATRGLGVVLLVWGLIAVLAWLGGFALFLRDARPDWRTVVYLEAGAWLDAHAGHDADLAFHEVGMLAFSSRRPVEDLLGLVTPRSLPYAREGDVVGAFLAKPTAYFVAHPFADGGAIRAITSRDWFRRAYVEVARFDHPELGGWLVIFARRPGAVLPAPRPPRPRPAQPAQPPAG
jgi:hypothetical protein